MSRNPKPLLARSLIIKAALCAGATLLFAVAASTYFFLDDFVWMYKARFEMATLAGWLHAFTAIAGIGYRPVSQQIFFWMSWHIFGFNPLGYHLLCLVTLLAASVYAYRVFCTILSNSWAALVGASLFAFSSAHYDSVAWASAFTETSATAAFIISIYFYVTRKNAASTAWYVIALLCDETASPLPAVAFFLSLVVQRRPFAESVKRSLPLWLILGIYAYLRVMFLGIPFSQSGPYAFHAQLSIYGPLIYQSILNCIGLLPPLHNVENSGGVPGVASSIAFTLLVAMVFAFGIGSVIGSQRSRAWRVALFGLLWFLFGLMPILVFTADNWSLYNLGIPLLGFGMMVSSAFLLPSLETRGAALVAAILIFVVNAFAIYGPGGWNDVDGPRKLAVATKSLYANLANEMRRTRNASVINVVAPGDLDNAAHVAGYNWGIRVLSGSASSNIAYTTRPLHDADMVFLWHTAGGYFRLVKSHLRENVARTVESGTTPPLHRYPIGIATPRTLAQARAAGIYSETAQNRCCFLAKIATLGLQKPTTATRVIMSFYVPQVPPLRGGELVHATFAGSSLVQTARITRSSTEVNFAIPPTLRAKKNLTMTLRMGAAFVPKVIGENGDVREISVMLIRVRVV
ncbi:MAG: hypothetical protein JO233_01515 [Candidatus Eremiobacteraeota bacterium]|nr:hypothetical protein [Candidatus Eremiobacteraeota bacterium]